MCPDFNEMSVETYLGENILPTMMKLDDEDFLAAVEITLDYEDSRPVNSVSKNALIITWPQQA